MFSDGSADAVFAESKGDEAAFAESIVRGFDREDYAGFYLSEDEYMRFDSMDEEDEAQMEVKKSEISLPTWQGDESAAFEYLGTY